MIKPHLNISKKQQQVQFQQASCSVLECLSAAGDDQTRSKHQQITTVSTAPAGCSVLECRQQQMMIKPDLNTSK